MDTDRSLDRTLTAPASTEIRVKGRPVRVNSTDIDGRTVIATGRWLRIASVKDEELVEGGAVNDPESFLAAVRRSGLRADVFTFAQRLPDVVLAPSEHGATFEIILT